MIQYFSSQGGGSGASLNYSVVGLAGIDPPAGKENRIWVNTSVPITGHIFSVKAPSGSDISENNIPKGFVWFKTGSASIVPFSATQKNPIMVYPQTCQQFNGTDWVTKKAKSYIGGDWHDWAVILFEPENAGEDFTGGYEGHPVDLGAVEKTSPTFDITTGITQRLVSEHYQKSGAIVTKNKINLTDFSKIQFDITLISTEQEYNPGGGGWVYVTQNADTAPPVEDRAQIGQVTSLNISNLTGDWYVAIGLKAIATQEGTQYGAVRAQVNSIIMS